MRQILTVAFLIIIVWVSSVSPLIGAHLHTAGLYALARNDKAFAERCFQKALDYDRHNNIYLSDMSFVLWRGKMVNEAHRYYTELMQHFNGDIVLYGACVQYGLLEMAVGNNVSGKEWCKKALYYNPRDEKALLVWSRLNGEGKQ